jgi:hypothetical protein
MNKKEIDMVCHKCNPRYWEAEIRGLKSKASPGKET